MAKRTDEGARAPLPEVAGKVFSGMTAVFLCVILFAFPLFYQDRYFDILEAKYRFYWLAAIALLAACLVVGLVFCFVDWKECGGVYGKRFFSSFRPATLRKQPFAFQALAVFWLFAALSTVLSDYVYESFWGNEGRFSGLFLITLYVATVFLIGKLGRIRKWYLDAFLVSSVLVCLFGITDYFRMDILHWKANVNSTQLDSFTSTMGNINTYTAFVALSLGVACGLFVTEKNPLRKIWDYAVILIAFFAIVTGQSDNAYLALGALFAVLPLILFGKRRGVADYVLLVASFMTVMRVIDGINQKMADQVIGLQGLFDFLVRYEKLEVIVIALWLLVAVLYILNFAADRKGVGQETGIWLRAAWGVFLAAAALAVLYVLYDANFGENPERYAALSRYLIFNDSWGTGRGYCWRIGWESYEKLPLVHRLFGFGPDTFGILTWDFRQESIEKYGVFFESAHNEYLQYLVTMGPFALAAYVAFLAGSCVRMIRAIKETPWILAPALAVLCYGAQALVNINLPIATPLMWALLAAGLALTRQNPRNLD